MSAAPLTVGGRYGRVGVEILRGSECVAVVGRMQANRLAHLDTVRNEKAKRGTQAHLAESEAAELERFEALALARMFAAAPDLLDALEDAVKVLENLDGMPYGSAAAAISRARAAIASVGRRS